MADFNFRRIDSFRDFQGFNKKLIRKNGFFH
jgi:hypothetical protein